MIYWFTGQPAAGKTTLAKLLIKHLSQNKYDIFHVDGDDIRDIFNNKDYSEIGRRKNIQTAQDIAQFLSYKNYDVVVSLVSPYKDQRDEFKKLVDVTEIYLYTTEDRGRNSYYVKDYQEPTENFISINTTNISELESLDQIINHFK